MPVIHIILSVLTLAVALVIMLGILVTKHDETRRVSIGAAPQMSGMRGKTKTAEQKLKMCIAALAVLFAVLALVMAAV